MKLYYTKKIKNSKFNKINLRNYLKIIQDKSKISIFIREFYENQ